MRTLAFLVLLLLLVATACRSSTPPDPSPAPESARSDETTETMKTVGSAERHQAFDQKARVLRFSGKANGLRKHLRTVDASAAAEN